MSTALSASNVFQSDVPHDITSLLTPVAPAVFLEQHWTRQPLFCQGSYEERFDALFSPSDLDGLIVAARDRAADWSVFSLPGGEDSRDFADATGQVQVSRLRDGYSRHGSLYLSQLQSNVPALLALVNQLTHFFHAEVSVNLWVNRGDTPAPYLHVEDHEMFILPLRGRQQWSVHDPRREVFLPAALTGQFDAAVVGPVRWTASTRAGDVLYIPAYCPYSIQALLPHVMYLAVSIYGLRWRDVLAAALQQIDRAGSALTQALPMALLRQPDENALINGVRQASLDALANVDAKALHDRLQALYVFNMVQPVDGLFKRLIEGNPVLTASSFLRRRAQAPCLVLEQSDKDTCSIMFPNGGEMAGPLPIASMLRYIATASTPFQADDLPADYDVDSRLVLLGRLVTLGLLEIVS